MLERCFHQPAKTMDPDRVRAYLQISCAGLGFDIGELWWTSNKDSGCSSALASIGMLKQQFSIFFLEILSFGSPVDFYVLLIGQKKIFVK